MVGQQLQRHGEQQRQQPGFMMRAAYTPLFGREGIVSFVGISLGRSF